MSEKGLKCKRAEFQPTADSVVCNVSNNEIISIKMSDHPIEDHMIRSFRERNLILEKENRWTIDFEYTGVLTLLFILQKKRRTDL